MSDAKPGVFFRHAVEAVFDRVVRVRGLDTPELRASLAAINMDLDKPRDIDLETWIKVIKTVARALTPNVSESEALTQMGIAALEGYADTLVGRGALLVSKLTGPKRSLVASAQAWATANDIYVVTTEDKGPKTVEIHLNVAGELTPYNRGILLGVANKLGIKATVDSRERANGVTYVVNWE